MRIVETKSNSPLSCLIRWAFKSKGSHILFSFDNDRWVVHSNLLGVNIRLYKNFMKSVTIVDELTYELSLEMEEQVFQSLLDQTSEDEYDYPGFFYFCWRALLFKLFNVPLPKKNEWGQAHMEICTEMIRKLPQWITNIPDDVDLGITVPDKAMTILREAKK